MTEVFLKRGDLRKEGIKQIWCFGPGPDSSCDGSVVITDALTILPDGAMVQCVHIGRKAEIYGFNPEGQSYPWYHTLPPGESVEVMLIDKRYIISHTGDRQEE